MIFKDSSITSNLKEERLSARSISRRRLYGGLSLTAIGLLLPFLPTTPSAAQDGNGEVKISEPVVTSAPLSYKSGNRPDPFYHLSEETRAKMNKKIEDVEISRGTPPAGIAGTLIDKAGLEGIVIRSDRRTAVVRGADSRAYFLHEGDRLFDGYLKAIREDSVVWIREKKMQSGNILTQDVIKRLRKP